MITWAAINMLKRIASWGTKIALVVVLFTSSVLLSSWLAVSSMQPKEPAPSVPQVDTSTIPVGSNMEQRLTMLENRIENLKAEQNGGQTGFAETMRKNMLDAAVSRSILEEYTKQTSEGLELSSHCFSSFVIPKNFSDAYEISAVPHDDPCWGFALRLTNKYGEMEITQKEYPVELMKPMVCEDGDSVRSRVAQVLKRNYLATEDYARLCTLIKKSEKPIKNELKSETALHYAYVYKKDENVYMFTDDSGDHLVEIAWSAHVNEITRESVLPYEQRVARMRADLKAIVSDYEKRASTFICTISEYGGCY
jgi:hypothetical protein